MHKFRSAAFPVTGPKLKTRKDIHGRHFKFKPVAFAFWGTKIRVMGQGKNGVWAHRQYSYGKAPKWLRQEIKQARKVYG